jgi:hypothetical protein
MSISVWIGVLREGMLLYAQGNLKTAGRCPIQFVRINSSVVVWVPFGVFKRPGSSIADHERRMIRTRRGEGVHRIGSFTNAEKELLLIDW